MKKANSSARWLITGGAGFIGSHVAGLLIKEKQNVTVFDNLSSGLEENIKAAGAGISFIKADVRNFDSVLSAVKGQDYIIHLAALPSTPLSVQNPLNILTNNLRGTANVLEAARQAGVKNVVFASSCAVYAAHSTPREEHSAIDPRSPYALSKKMGESLCLLYHQSYAMNVIVLRYFNVFGPRQTAISKYSPVMPRFFSAALNKRPFLVYRDGFQSRDFIHVEDAAAATLLAARKGQGGEVYNVARGKPISLLHLAALTATVAEMDPAFSFTATTRIDETLYSTGNIGKLAALGFKPKRGLQESLEEWWKQIKAREL